MNFRQAPLQNDKFKDRFGFMHPVFGIFNHEIFYAARRWYTQGRERRHYHNLEHSTQVVQAVLDLRPTFDYDVVLAARWHDAVYIPNAGGDYNEHMSACALQMEYDELEHSQELNECVASAKLLIESTSLRHHLATTAFEDKVSVLLDADLSPMADEYSVFKERQASILRENGHPPVTTNRMKSAQWLYDNFFAKPSIYRTAEGIAKYEHLARANILRYFEETVADVEKMGERDANSGNSQLGTSGDSVDPTGGEAG